MAIDKAVDSGALDTGLTSIANKIRSRSGGSNQLLFPTGFVSEIDNIPQGGGGMEEKDVNFYDYDGSLVASYTATEFAALSAMPSNPSHTGLTAQGWNWTLADAKTYVASYGKLNVGQMYITSDGSTRIYVDFTGWQDEVGFYLNLYFTTSGSNEVSVDFGDGSEAETLSLEGSGWASLGHWYDPYTATEYVITITPITGTFNIRPISTANNSTATHLLGYLWEDAPSGYTTTKEADQAFANVITKIELGSSVTLNSGAFCMCSHLKYITIPNTVASIGTYAFTKCYDLKSITIPNSVTYLGTSIFDSCDTIETIILPKEITSLGKTIFQSCPKLKSMTVPSSVTSIGETAFYACKSIQYIIIPSGVTSIPKQMCQSCERLKSVTIPNTVTSIGDSAFASCLRLESITIPSGVTSIGASAFSTCHSIKSITIPSGVTSIPTSMCNSCKDLESVTIPSSVTNIGQNAFSGCNSLKSITIPSGVTSIGASAFSNCYTLQFITIPSNVTSIGASAFSGCSHVTAYDIDPTTPPTLGSSNVFTGIQQYCIMWVSDLSAYQTATNWRTYASYMAD